MHDIVHELTIAVPPAAVYEAITTQAGLASWWTTDCDARPEVDSIATFTFGPRGGLSRSRVGHPGEDTVTLTMKVDLLESPELVHWDCTGGPDEWVGTKIAYRVEGVDTDGDGEPDGGSLVRFWHGEWEFEDGLLPGASFQWAMDLDSLRRHLETGTGSPATD